MEVVVSANESKPRGSNTAGQEKTKAQPVPDKNWYRKWQEGQPPKEKETPRG